MKVTETGFADMQILKLFFFYWPKSRHSELICISNLPLSTNLIQKRTLIHYKLIVDIIHFLISIFSHWSILFLIDHEFSSFSNRGSTLRSISDLWYIYPIFKHIDTPYYLVVINYCPYEKKFFLIILYVLITTRYLSYLVLYFLPFW